MDTFERKTSFTETTKYVCIYLAISVFIIVLYAFTPVKNHIFLSMIIKVFILLLLAYTIYLNGQQGYVLLTTDNTNMSIEAKQQVTMNIISSYTLTLFMIILLCYTIIKC